MKYNDCNEQLINAFEYSLLSGSFNKRNIIDSVENVCIFGLGRYFEEAFEQQNVKERFHINLLCDNNKDKLEEVSNRKGYFEELRCISLEELAKIDSVAVILMLGDPRSAEAQLRELGLNNIITYNDMVLDEVMNGNRDKEWFKNQKEDIFRAYNMLSDEESKKVFVNILCNRIAPQFSKYKYDELCILPQYFPKDILSLTENESLIDCGAYDGDTLESFLEISNNKFNKIYCFELDKDNYIKLSNNVNKLEKEINERIECFDYGVWNENKIISYGKMSSEDSFSIFNDRDITTSEVIKLDDLLSEKEITLIKMDIEGAEMMALEGCEKIIKEQKPKMAICVYHRIEDLWKIPIYLKELVPNYNISIRHHANFWVSETVCYAYVD
ncbi:FkbM family methyltransferase [Clostridium beijerinckii]|uniref:FkbM family methyltransferase n=1 Tax=Clostridium beijerinckii TaxID=1520 RepID=UPI00232ACCEF|nr:FkbM family methyltransferase [Clostridium beijerinckii]